MGPGFQCTRQLYPHVPGGVAVEGQDAGGQRAVVGADADGAAQLLALEHQGREGLLDQLALALELLQVQEIRRTCSAQSAVAVCETQGKAARFTRLHNHSLPPLLPQPRLPLPHRQCQCAASLATASPHPGVIVVDDVEGLTAVHEVAGVDADLAGCTHGVGKDAVMAHSEHTTESVRSTRNCRRDSLRPHRNIVYTPAA